MEKWPKRETQSRIIQRNILWEKTKKVRIQTIQTSWIKRIEDLISENPEPFQRFYDAINVGDEIQENWKTWKFVEINLPMDENFKWLQCKCFVYLHQVNEEFQGLSLEIKKSDMERIGRYFKANNINFIDDTNVLFSIMTKAGYMKISWEDYKRSVFNFYWDLGLGLDKDRTMIILKPLD